MATVMGYGPHWDAWAKRTNRRAPADWPCVLADAWLNNRQNEAQKLYNAWQNARLQADAEPPPYFWLGADAEGA